MLGRFSSIVFAVLAIGSLLSASAAFSNVSEPVSRTSQAFDVLVIDDDTLGIANTPLAPLLAVTDSASRLSFNRVDTTFHSGGDISVQFNMCSSCWRGYQALWRIERDSLFLTGAQSCCGPEREHTLDQIGDWLGIEHQKERAFASWYSGTLRAPQGALLQVVSSGFESVYAEEIRLRVENGQVTRIDTLQNTPYLTPTFPGGASRLEAHIRRSIDPRFLPLATSKQEVEAEIIVDTTGRARVQDVRIVDLFGTGSSNPSASQVDAIRSTVQALPRFMPGVRGGRTHPFEGTLSLWRDEGALTIQLADLLPVNPDTRHP
jgi:hypothetical protein